MPFIKCVRTFSPKPAALYLHETGYAEAFGEPLAGVEYFIEMLDAHPGLVDHANYILAGLWGDQGKKVAELWGYGEMKKWSDNPTLFKPWVFMDGIYVSDPRNIGCGDMTIAFGLEEQHRRTCKDINEFLCRHPSVPENLWSNKDRHFTFYSPAYKDEI